MDVRVGLSRRLSAEELMLLNGSVGEDSWESLGLQGDPTSPFWRRSALGFLWRELCWSWNPSTLVTSCEDLTHWKRLWCWEGLGQEEKGTTEDEMAGWHHWLNGHESEWTPGVGDGQGGPGVLRFMGSQRVGHDWATDLIWMHRGPQKLGTCWRSYSYRGRTMARREAVWHRTHMPEPRGTFFSW